VRSEGLGREEGEREEGEREEGEREESAESFNLP
jgi:hypothetical protein